jgi:hypothetical protein
MSESGDVSCSLLEACHSHKRIDSIAIICQTSTDCLVIVQTAVLCNEPSEAIQISEGAIWPWPCLLRSAPVTLSLALSLSLQPDLFFLFQTSLAGQQTVTPKDPTPLQLWCDDNDSEWQQGRGGAVAELRHCQRDFGQRWDSTPQLSLCFRRTED